MFKGKKIIGLCLFLVALFAPTAHAEEVLVDPGNVGGEAQNFYFSNNPAVTVDLVWSDNKTLEWEAGTHVFFLAGAACANYAGILLDEAGTEIPETELIGKTQCAAGSELSSGLIELPETTVFSGIRLSGPFNTDAGWQWNWDPANRPVVGEIQASGNQPPIPDTGGPYVGVAGIPVTFDASASTDNDGTITTYIWDFGDNTTLGGKTVQHNYASGDKWHVTLTVTDDKGTSASKPAIADIGDASLRPTADDGGPYTGETLTNVAFSGLDSEDPDGTVDQYAWDFGDGTPEVLGTATPLHPYTDAGTYYVVLTVTDNTGETDKTVTTATITTGKQEAPVADAGPPAEGTAETAVTFDGRNSSGNIVQYDWDYGDLTTGINAGPTPNHTYAAAGDYTVLLTVMDGDGVKNTDDTAAAIDANPLPPTADAGSPVDGTAGVAVSFDGTGSDDPDGGTIVTYAWDFGDGSPIDTVSGASPSHIYSAGSYTVKLTVTDNDGLSSAEDTTEAAIDQANSPPTSDAGGPYAGAMNTPVLLNGFASSDDDGVIVQYDWDFDDGNTGNGPFPQHIYTVPGSYTAKLTVTDNDGGTDESNAKVIIGDAAKVPPRPFTNGPYNGVAGVPLTFDGSNSSDPDGTINLYEWTFGDGNSLIGPMPTNNYVMAGLYGVILQVTDDDSFTASEGTIARIGGLSLSPNAVANASNEPYQGRVGVPVAFNGGDSNDPDGTINRYDWTFGDGATANDAGRTPAHVYATGRYFARLTVTDNTGETDTTVTAVTIGRGNLPPLVNAGEAVSGTVGNPITFDGSASRDQDGSIDSYAWNFGDGNTATGPNSTQSHTYAAAGKYFVSLSVTDSDGTVNSDMTVADVAPADGSDGGGGGGSNLFGCSMSNGEVKDPTLLLLLLLSVIHLARRRAA